MTMGRNGGKEKYSLQ